MRSEEGTGKIENPRRSRLKYFFLACLLYALLLAVSVFSAYHSGGGLYNQVVWDPVPLYLFHPGDSLGLSALKSGFLPLWDSTRGLGNHNLVPMSATIDHPLKILAFLIDRPWGWELVTLLKFYLAGIFCFLAASEFKMSFPAALFSGLCFMLCGYFRIYYNVPDMDVLVLFPLSLLFIHKLCERPRLLWLVPLCIIGHLMDHSPEPAIWCIIYSTAFYFFICSASIPGRRRSAGSPLFSRALIYSAFMFGILANNPDCCLQIFEVYLKGWHFHPENLGMLHAPSSSLIALATPVFDLWISAKPNLSLPYLEQLTLVPAYFGTVSLILALHALLRAGKLNREGRFFAASAIVSGGVIFGIPPFLNLAASLPLVKLFQNFRYLQPLLALSLAFLAGFGLEMLIRNQSRDRLFYGVSAAVAIWLFLHLYIFRQQLVSHPLVRENLVVIVGGFAALLAVFLLLARRGAFRDRKGKAAVIILLSSLELALYFNLVRPLYGPEAFNTAPPPAADFIKKHGPAEPFRMWGMDQRIMHPNLAGTWGLSDIRDYTPLYLKDYVELIKAINRWETDEQAALHFLEHGKFYLDLDWNRLAPPLLDLLNIRYVLSFLEPGAEAGFDPGEDLEGILSEAPGRIVRGDFFLQGRHREGFLLHAPSSVRVRVSPRRKGLLHAEAGILPRARECPDADGITLSVFREVGPYQTLVYARTLRQDQDKSWLPFDFGSGPGGTSYTFASLPGPRDNRHCDFGVFSMPERVRAGGASLESHGLKLIYDKEFKVYENTDVLPRVFSPQKVYHGEDLTAFIAFARTRGPGESASIADRDREKGAEQCAPALITNIKERFGRLEFKAASKGRAFAAISNLYFPGFRAWVNGKETRLFRTNGVMQGLWLPPGKNEVIVAFAPWTYRIALWWRLSAESLAVLLLFAAFKKSRGSGKSSL